MDRCLNMDVSESELELVAGTYGGYNVLRVKRYPLVRRGFHSFLSDWLPACGWLPCPSPRLLDGAGRCGDTTLDARSGIV